MRLIDADALLTERKKSKYYHLPNGDIAIPIIDVEHAPTVKSKPQWIPCSERLPEEYGEFLVTMTEKAKAKDLGVDIDENYIRKMRYNSNGWQLPRHIPSWINEAVKDEVLAWMPLPEPYKTESEDKE